MLDDVRLEADAAEHLLQWSGAGLRALQRPGGWLVAVLGILGTHHLPRLRDANVLPSLFFLSFVLLLGLFLSPLVLLGLLELFLLLVLPVPFLLQVSLGMARAEGFELGTDVDKGEAVGLQASALNMKGGVAGCVAALHAHEAANAAHTALQLPSCRFDVAHTRHHATCKRLSTSGSSRWDKRRELRSYQRRRALESTRHTSNARGHPSPGSAEDPLSLQQHDVSTAIRPLKLEVIIVGCG